MDQFLLKTELLCYGAELAGEVACRRSGAGPAGACIELEGMVVSMPVSKAAVSRSRFKLEQDERVYLRSKDERMAVRMIERPGFYGKLTSDGVPMHKVALLHGRDCLATTLYQSCIYKRAGRGCRFCAIEGSLQSGSTILRKTPQQLLEVLEEARSDGVRHVTITTGTPNTRDHGARMLGEAAALLKENFDLPVHVQLTPPGERSLELLHDSGVDTIGIHMECLDPAVMQRMCPGKHGLDYDSSLRAAVTLFGEEQVSSYVLAGLGERGELMRPGFEKLAALGVVPFLVPFRPLPGSELADHSPPQPAYLAMLYAELAEVLREQGVDPKRNRAGCVRCGACSALDKALERWR